MPDLYSSEKQMYPLGADFSILQIQMIAVYLLDAGPSHSRPSPILPGE